MGGPVVKTLWEPGERVERACDTCEALPCECVMTASFYLGEPVVDLAAVRYAALIEAGEDPDGYSHHWGFCSGCGVRWLSGFGFWRCAHEPSCRYHPSYLPDPPEGVRLERTATVTIKSKPPDPNDHRIAYLTARMYAYEQFGNWWEPDVYWVPRTEEASMELADSYLATAQRCVIFNVYGLYR